MLKHPFVIRIFALAPLLLILGGLNACDRFYGKDSELKALVGDQPQRTLRVAILTGYSQAPAANLETDLLVHFATSTGLKIEWQKYRNRTLIETALLSGDADIGALQHSGSIHASVWVGPSYKESSTALLCPDNINPKDTPTIVTPVNRNTPMVQRLLNTKDWKNGGTSKLTAHELIKKSLRAKNSFCVIAEKDEADRELQINPQLQRIKSLRALQSFRFLVSRQRPNLLPALHYWHQKISQDGTLYRFRESYDKSTSVLNDADTDFLVRSTKQTLPDLKKWMLKSAAKYQLPWTLLAAVSFQESHWNPDAVSMTGVRGLMMLTQETAEHMGIEDRVDPQQSLEGGAKYLRFLFNNQPGTLRDRDRLALTLASYNIGLGHLQDAQTLALILGKNPMQWQDLRDVLPLLSKRDYYENLEYGEARGQEAVDFTERTIAFFDLLNSY